MVKLCRIRVCLKEALFKSNSCWEHLEDKENYKKLILQPGKEGRINLASANLRGVDLVGSNLHGADLRRTNLKEAILEGAILSESNLLKADLSESNLSGANLMWADLEGANLEGARLVGANLIRVCFDKTDLTGVDLTEADLSGAFFMGMYLDRIKMERAKLTGANLIRAYLEGANLAEANLMGASLEKANLTKVYLCRANLVGANLAKSNLEMANLKEANLQEANLRGANLSKADLSNTDLRSAIFNEANLTESVLTGAKIWGMSRAGCKIENMKADFLNVDKDGNPSGVLHLTKDQIVDLFSAQPIIEIVLQNKLPTYVIRTLLDLVDKINKQNPDWGVEFRKITSGSFLSELIVTTNKDEILEKVANFLLIAFKGYHQKLLEYLPEKKEVEDHSLVSKKLEGMQNKINNPLKQVTIFHVTGNIVNIPLEVHTMRDFKISGKKVKIGKITNIDVGGDLYNISAPQGRVDLIKNLINELDSPEIGDKIKYAESELKGLSTKEVEFLKEEFKRIAESIFKEKQKEPGFLNKVKAFSQRFSEAAMSKVVGSAIWYAIQKFILPSP